MCVARGQVKQAALETDVVRACDGAFWAESSCLSSLELCAGAQPHSWQGQGAHRCVHSVAAGSWAEGRSGSPQGLLLILGSGEIVDRVLSEEFSRPLKEKVVAENSLHGFAKGKSAPTSLPALQDEVMRSGDDRRVVGVIHRHFAEAFTTVPHSILLSKLGHSSADGRIPGCRKPVCTTGLPVHSWSTSEVCPGLCPAPCLHQ